MIVVFAAEVAADVNYSLPSQASNRYLQTADLRKKIFIKSMRTKNRKLTLTIECVTLPLFADTFVLMG